MKKMFKIGLKDEGKRLDKFLSQKMKFLSRTRIKELIKERFILVNEERKEPSYALKVEDTIKVEIPSQKKHLASFFYPVEIIYEDEEVIVVNKPQGLVVHPPRSDYSSTLVGALLTLKKRLSGINPLRRGVVHRLDKETSGVMVLAKTNFSHLNLVKQFQERKVKKEYRAIVWGAFGERMKIDLPIKRDEKVPLKMKVGFFKAKEALTQINVLKKGKNFSYLSIQLITGRTHQIRVHLSFLGYPVVGDKKYGAKGDNYKRLLLHSYSLGFYHPSTGKFLEFTCNLPEYFSKFLRENV
ncbi:MAG: RNA pseudouridine synthase [Candidatus Omnitrophota bacterium]|nr:MAG: RNA pseudouridine synthase [Candidatus Omnitrophota bacterium]